MIICFLYDISNFIYMTYKEIESQFCLKKLSIFNTYEYISPSSIYLIDYVFS